MRTRNKAELNEVVNNYKRVLEDVNCQRKENFSESFKTGLGNTKTEVIMPIN